MEIEMLSPSEALFGFIAWLTTRKETVTFGAKCDSAEAAELAIKFIQANNLPPLREDWLKNLVHPHA